MEKKYNYNKLLEFASLLFIKAGLPNDRAETVSSYLVEADLMGHTTHGLSLLPAYISEIKKGSIPLNGQPIVVSDRGSAITWDGQYLPGPWLMQEAIDLSFERIKDHPVVTVVIKRSHHIGCLAVYPEQAAEKGYIMLLTCSDPRDKAVSPYGSVEGVYSPNPVAAGIPTNKDPVVIDISTSATANGVVNKYLKAGKNLPHKWLLDNQGNPTDDPNAVLDEPRGTILPLGGIESGYKGYALGILVEALTSGLAGYGRSNQPQSWGSSVFLQIIDPAAFGGIEQCKNENQFLADACLNSKPIKGHQPRLPGSRAFKLRAEQKKAGVRLYPGIMSALETCAKEMNVEIPVF